MIGSLLPLTLPVSTVSVSSPWPAVRNQTQEAEANGSPIRATDWPDRVFEIAAPVNLGAIDIEEQ